MSKEGWATIKPKIQDDVKLLAKQTQQIISQASSPQFQIDFQESYYECDGRSEKQCFSNYTMSNCLNQGAKIAKHSGVRYPSKELTCEDKVFTLITTKLDKTFQGIKYRHLDRIERSYIGLETGFFRAYPGNKKSCEKVYDPRERLWYAKATTGSKKIIIKINLSNLSVGQLNQIKISTKQVIDSLNINDFIGVIICKQEAEFLIFHQMKRAQGQIQTALKYALGKLEPFQPISTPLNLTKSFSKVIKSFNQTSIDLECSKSTKIVLLFSKNHTYTINQQLVTQENINSKIIVFSYTSTNSTVLKTISCATGGTYHEINQYENLPKVLRNYQNVIKHFLNNDQPNWTEPYNDFNTGRRTITAYTPIYAYYNGWRRIIGAAGIDVFMNSIEGESYNEQSILNIISCKSNEEVTVDHNLLQFLRQTNRISRCDESIDLSVFRKERDNQIKYFQKHCGSIRAEVIGQPIERDDTNIECCGIQTKVLVIIILVIVSFILFTIVGFLLYLHRKYRRALKAVENTQKTGSEYQSAQQSRRQGRIEESNVRMVVEKIEKMADSYSKNEEGKEMKNEETNMRQGTEGKKDKAQNIGEQDKEMQKEKDKGI